jgi:hypothetical protein
MKTFFAAYCGPVPAVPNATPQLSVGCVMMQWEAETATVGEISVAPQYGPVIVLGLGP